MIAVLVVPRYVVASLLSMRPVIPGAVVPGPMAMVSLLIRVTTGVALVLFRVTVLLLVMTS